MSTNDQKVEAAGREFILTRTFRAPRELVFRAYSSCEHLREWWGPRSWPMAECTMDFRVGGVWHYCLRGPDPGDESWGLAEFEEIVPPERIAYTDTFSDAKGKVDDAMPRARSIVSLEETDGGTRLMVRATYPSEGDLQTVLDMGMVAGLTETLDRLEEHLSRALGGNH